MISYVETREKTQCAALMARSAARVLESFSRRIQAVERQTHTCYLWSHLLKFSGFTSVNFNKFTLCRWFTRSATKSLVHAAFILFHFFLWHSCFIQIFQSWCNLNLKRFLNLTWTPFVYIHSAGFSGRRLSHTEGCQQAIISTMKIYEDLNARSEFEWEMLQQRQIYKEQETKYSSWGRNAIILESLECFSFLVSKYISLPICRVSWIWYHSASRLKSWKSTRWGTLWTRLARGYHNVRLDQACYDSGVLMVKWEGTFVSKMTNDILGETAWRWNYSMHPLLAGALKVFWFKEFAWESIEPASS